jgi:aminoglycoside 6'-N-acetyltransferase I
MLIRPVQPDDLHEWLRMRRDLWPDGSEQEHLQEMQQYFAPDAADIAFVAVRPSGKLAGFLEASLRRYADGCSTSPVGYIEGWFVDDNIRRQGIGALLVAAAENWAAAQGCVEMASDCLLDNVTSLAAHLALGYDEAERLIHFRKSIASGNSR